MERLLPRHMQIIRRLNADLLAALADQDIDPGAVALIDHAHGHRVRMGHLAFYGAHKVNGVSALHTELMKRTVFRDLHRAFPERITNKTNGITARRWLRQCNPGAVGPDHARRSAPGWLTDLEQLEALAPLAEDAAFRERFARAKRANKERLAALIARAHRHRGRPGARCSTSTSSGSTSTSGSCSTSWRRSPPTRRSAPSPSADWTPRVKIFGGKAAASYRQAKLIIKLINDVARTINSDPVVGDRLKVIFLPNYNVSLTEKIIPAADLSEQISTAGMEASGTGNMKLALNGALTIGTLDGANIEIRELVGHDNMFIFGLTAEEVQYRRANGYQPRAEVEAAPALAAVYDAIASGAFSPDDPGRFRPLIEQLLGHDYFMVSADFARYAADPAGGRRGVPRARRPGGGGRSSTPPRSAGSRPIARSATTRARSGALCRARP